MSFFSVLNMDHQIRNIAKSCYHQLVTLTLVYARVTSHGVCTSSLSSLQRTQNTSARIITRNRKFGHITPVLVKLHWLLIEQRIQYKLILQTFKALHRLSPLYIQELVQVYKPNMSLRSESYMLLVQSRARTRSYCERRFDVASSMLWNNLPQNLWLEKIFILF